MHGVFSTLAGSTIMLLTVAWGGSLIIGRCDIDAATNEAVDGTGKRGFYLTTQVHLILCYSPLIISALKKFPFKIGAHL